MASQQGGVIACVNTNPAAIAGSVALTKVLFDGNFASNYLKEGSGGVFYFQTV
jgi:hypothetical protein